MTRAMVFLLGWMLSCSAALAQRTPNRSPVIPSGGRTLWIIGEHGRLSAYDGSDFHRLREGNLPLPTAARAHPERISISHDGLVLYPVSRDGERHWYLWRDGRVRKLSGATHVSRSVHPDIARIIDTDPSAKLSADGERLFWFENRLSVLRKETGIDAGIDLRQSGEFIGWVSGLDNHRLKTTARFSLAPCTCDTGVCEETCPVVDEWVPNRGVSDFFFLTRWVPGQLTSDYLETDLYRRVGGVWKKHKLSQPVQGFLDAARHGRRYVAAVYDTACCGWENASDNITYVVADGRRTTLFNEFDRFRNKDYDISFFTPKARFSPGAKEIAYVVSATAKPGAKIRLAAEGKTNQGELRHILQALTGLPRVEVVRVADPAKMLFSLAKARLIGWLDPRRLLIWQHGKLLVVDTDNWQLKATGLTVKNVTQALIR